MVCVQVYEFVCASVCVCAISALMKIMIMNMLTSMILSWAAKSLFL